MARCFCFRISFRSATVAMAVLFSALTCATPLHAQTAVQGAPRGTVIHPVAPPPPVPVTPVRVPGVAPPPVLRAPVLHPPVSPGVLTVRPFPPAIRAVRPIIITSAPTGNLTSAGAPPFRVSVPGAPVASNPFRPPPESPRLLMHAPRVAPLATPSLPANPLVAAIPPLSLGAAPIGSALLAPQPIVVPHLYCSPDSVMFNTGSICFDPSNETIDPSFYPWGLYAPPPFVNEPGFVPEFLPGLLVQFTPQWTKWNAGLFPPESPFDRWKRLTAGGLPGLLTNPSSSRVEAEPVQSPSVTPAGPPVVLVTASGATVLATSYWLGRDWMLDYISVTGQRGAIPLDELNLQATGKMNYARGVVFVLPGWPSSRANR